MAKPIIFLAILASLYSCTQKENQDFPGSNYIGNWHMEEIKSPKYPHYVYDYSITKYGEAFMVKVHVTCPKCKDPKSQEKNTTFTGTYNSTKGAFEIQKNGFQEILSINESDSNLISSRFSKYKFSKTN